MNKYAYAKVMGLIKKAEDKKPVWTKPGVGYGVDFADIKKSLSNLDFSLPSTKQFAQRINAGKTPEQAAKPQDKPDFTPPATKDLGLRKTPEQNAARSSYNNELFKIMRNFGKAYNTPGELSFWGKLWAMLRSLFGSEDADRDWQAHIDATAGRAAADKALSAYATTGANKYKDKLDKALFGDTIFQAAKRAVPREAKAQAIAQQMKEKYKLSDQQAGAISTWLFTEGARNRHQTYAPQENKVPEGLPVDAVSRLKELGPLQTKVNVPSYKDQLMGETATV